MFKLFKYFLVTGAWSDSWTAIRSASDANRHHRFIIVVDSNLSCSVSCDVDVSGAVVDNVAIQSRR